MGVATRVVKCPRCEGEAFKITRERLGNLMLASEKMTVTCIGCGYSESLYKIGDE